MTNTYIDMDGVENVAVGLINQARKDFVKGAKILYKHLKKIPSYAELIKDKIHMTLSNDKDVRNMYDSWRFVHEDPYSFFGDVGEEAIINAWRSETVIAYYKDLYIKGAIAAYRSGFKVKKKELYDISDSSLKSRVMKDNDIRKDFIEARNYIRNIPNGLDYLDEWNSIAYERVKKMGDREPLSRSEASMRSEYTKQRVAQRRKDMEKAWELKQGGLSVKAIAKYMMRTECCIRNYIREMEAKQDS